MYDLAFTAGFRDSLDSMPGHVIETLTRFITRLRADPFQKLPQAKKLKNFHNRFRARIAGDYRAIYRIERTVKRVVLLTIASRQSVYQRDPAGGKVLSGPEEEEIRKRLAMEAADSRQPTSVPAEQILPSRAMEEVEVEQLTEWISVDELALIQVPDRYHEAILATDDPHSLTSEVVPQAILDRVLDYVTNPASSHIGKLYSAREASDIARLPLKSFMLALDKEQQRVIDRALDSGPLLVKGGPGTGKSLVGLYRMQKIVEHRAAESMFSTSPRFGVLTFTNTLADLNEALTEEISGKLRGEGELICSTLDKITYKLAGLALNRRPNLKSEAEIVRLLTEAARGTLSGEEQEVVDRLGMDYVVNEIERVILGFGVDDVGEYLAHKRTSRAVGLNERYRRVIWKLYDLLLALHRDHSVESWGLFRKIALEYLQSTPSFPRFNALFVDEVQDLSRTSRRLILNLVMDRRFLIMTADTGQSIYEYPPTWSQTDDTLNLSGRVFVLRRNYRTTRENYQAIKPLRLESDDGVGETGQPMPVYSGEPPVWLSASSDAQLEATAEVISQLSKMHHLGQIAVIVRDHTQIKTYSQYLKSQAIESKPVTRDSKIDITSPHVHVITAHSSKGLEFPAVVVPDVSDETFPWERNLQSAADDEQLAEVVGLEQRLLYVALSRACHSLVMIENSDCPSRFLSLLKPELWRGAL